MYRKRIIETMKAVEREHAVAVYALAVLQSHLQKTGTRLPNALKLAAMDVRRCSRHLEATYYIRLFAVFESALRDVWQRALHKPTMPQARQLINSCASRCRIPDDELQAAQKVRGYRNTLVHGGDAEPVPLDQALSSLSVFLSRMPPQW